MIRRRPIAVVASLVAASSASAQAPDDESTITTWVQPLDRPFMAKDLDKLASFYHRDVTTFEGGRVNSAWTNYRDHQIGPDLKGSENIRFEHRIDGGRAAYVTSEYAFKTRTNSRDVDGGSLETLVLVKVGDAWKIRRSHTSARRRPAGGPGHPNARD